MSIRKINRPNLMSGTPKPDEPKVLNKYHGNIPANAVYIGRGSPWGNPFVIGKDGTRDEVIALYKEHILPKLDVEPLRGQHLVCFCKPAACHGDAIMEKLKCAAC